MRTSNQRPQNYFDKKYLTELKKNSSGIAVFDADGTLWRGDIGDDFFAKQRNENLMKSAPFPSDKIMTHYEKLHHDRPGEAYGMMGLWNAGAAECDMIQWCRELWDTIPDARIIQSQKDYVALLHDVGFEVWVVSASLWWVVAEGVNRHFQIPPHRVIATKTRVEKGQLIDQFANDVPYRSGKVANIRSQIAKNPAIVSGNSMGDYEMMGLASDQVLVMTTAKPGDLYYQTEQDLLALVPQNLDLKPYWFVCKE